MIVTLANHFGLTAVGLYYTDIVSMVGANSVLIQGITISVAGTPAPTFLAQGSVDKEIWVPATTTAAKAFATSVGGQGNETWGPFGWPYMRVEISQVAAGQTVVAILANTFSK